MSGESRENSNSHFAHCLGEHEEAVSKLGEHLRH